MKRNKIVLCIILFIFTIFIYRAYANTLPKWFPFNDQNALKDWKEKIFKNRVLYIVESKHEGGYLLAKSKEACSGLLYKVKFDPRVFPMISWRWKVLKFPDKQKVNERENAGWIEKDDYAARVYVIFTSWNFLNIKSIEYIWDETLPEGTIMTSPYFRKLKLIVVESGTKNMDEWVFEERNIVEDYETAFGKKPRRYVGAIALMTDSDNTLSTAEALYKDMKVGYKNE